MKKLILTSFSLLLYLSSYSQFNYFFPDSNAYFSVSYMKFWFQGDTIIENLQYKKVYVQPNNPIADFSKAWYFAAIREDAIAEKVYCVLGSYEFPQYSTEEYLLYDFSVNVGDTVSFYTLWGERYPHMKTQVVESIDSILIDSHYRKRINFNTWYWNQDSWIEGIGSTQGLFFAGSFDMVDGMDWTELLCVHIDDKVIYQIDDDCYRPPWGNRIDENKKEAFKIYPTVVDDFLYIETDKNSRHVDYKIINTQGQIMDSGVLTSNAINVANLSKGFYLIVISDNASKKNIKTGKFVKH